MNKVFSRFCNNSQPPGGRGAVGESSGSNVPLNFNGHCTFCLEKLTPMNSSRGGALKSVNHIWPYIQPCWKDGTVDFTFIQGKTLGGTAIKSKTPPMCATCSDRFRGLDQLHQELLLIQKKLRDIAGEIKTTVVDSSVEGKFSFRRKTFLKGLKEANVPEHSIDSTVQFLKKLEESDQNPDLSTPVCADGANTFMVKVDPGNILLDPLSDDLGIISTLEKTGTETMNVDGDVPVPCSLNHSASQEHSKSNSDQENGKGDKEAEINYRQWRKKRISRLLTTYSLSGRKSLDRLPKINGTRVNRNNLQLCTVCAKNIPREKIYEHTRGHVGDYAYKCPLPDCTYTALCRWRFVREHVQRQKFHVSKCNVIFTNLKAEDHPGYKQCEICHETFNHLSALWRHLAKYHEDPHSKKLKCPLDGCKMKFSVRQSVEIHLFSRHNHRKTEPTNIFQKCKICLGLIRNENLKHHYAVLHDVTDIPECPLCSTQFQDRARLINHMASHQEEGMVCDICDSDETFSEIDSLRSHYYTEHQVGRKFPCAVCKFQAFNRTDLESHQLKNHCMEKGSPSSKLAKLQCKLCDKTFSRKSNLMVHFKLHKRNSVICVKCGESFTSRLMLAEHVCVKREIETIDIKCEHDPDDD